MSSRLLYSSLTLTLWLGIYALRTYVPSAVWNLADELPLSQKPLLAVGTHVLGMLGVLIVFKQRRRALFPITYLFAAVTILRQIFIANDAIGPWLSLLSWVFWLMLVAALADEVAAHDEERVIAPALATAVALQVGMQAAWHGLDLPSVSGIVSVVVATIIALLLAFNVHTLPVPLLKRPHTSTAWMLLGPALFLEVTLAGNVGRFGEATGFGLLASGLLIIAAHFLAVVVIRKQLPRWATALLIAATGLAVYAVPRVHGIDGLILLVVPLVITGGLHAATNKRVRISGTTASTIGTLLLFALIFAFYNFYEMPVLWAVALLTLAVVLLMGASEQRRADTPFAGFAIAVVLSLLHLMPAPRTEARRASDEMTVVSYNIHHGFDDDGVPGVRRTANEIAGMQPDIAAFQEISRGWTLLGGSDLIAFMRWRFPEYRVFFSATNGQLWGNAIMSRLPVRSVRGDAFAAEPGVFRYGWIHAVIDRGDAPFSFYSVHLTADLEGFGGDARVAQADALARIVGDISPVIIAGDFNAHPTDPPINVIKRGYVDLGERAGLGALATWPAGHPNERIDYIFGRGVTVSAGQVLQTPASDHLPVLIKLRMDTTESQR